MKLLFCPVCADVTKLQLERRTCRCGQSWGWYEKDGRHATVGGRAEVIGIDNNSIVRAVQLRTPTGNHLHAWLFGAESERVSREKVDD